MVKPASACSDICQGRTMKDWINDNLCSHRPSARRLFIKLMKKFTVVMPQEIKRYTTLIHKSNMSSDWEYNYYRGHLTSESQKNLFISQVQLTTAAHIYSWSTNKEATFYGNLTWQEQVWWTCGKHWSTRLMRTCMCLVPTTYQNSQSSELTIKCGRAAFQPSLIGQTFAGGKNVWSLAFGWYSWMSPGFVDHWCYSTAVQIL